MKRIFLSFLVLAVLDSCVPKIKTEPLSAGSCDLSKPVVLGGSTMAGYRDGALFNDGQKTAVGNLLLMSFSEVSGLPYSEWNMASAEGLGWNFNSPQSPFRTRGRLANLADCEGVVGLGVARNYFAQNAAGPLLDPIGLNFVPNNLAIPFSTLDDWMNPAFGISVNAGGKNAFYPRITTNPGTATVFSDAHSLNPTFVAMWPGMEDIMNWASMGAEENRPMSSGLFESKLDSLIGQFAANGAKGILANVPDIDALPFFTTFPTDGLELGQVKADSLNELYHGGGTFLHINFHEGKNGFAIQDTNAPNGYRLTDSNDRILLTAPKDSIKCKKWGVVFIPLPATVVLLPAEIAEIRSTIAAYNIAIEKIAGKYNFAMLDIASVYEQIRGEYMLEGINYNSVFVSGGFFSVDGLNPNPKGAALITNEFIRAINLKYGANIPTKVVSTYEGLVFP